VETIFVKNLSVLYHFFAVFFIAEKNITFQSSKLHRLTKKSLKIRDHIFSHTLSNIRVALTVVQSTVLDLVDCVRCPSVQCTWTQWCTLRIMYLLCKRYALFHLCFVQLCCVNIRVRFYVSDQMLHGQQSPPPHCGFILTYISQNHISPVSHEIYSWGYTSSKKD